MNRRQGIAIWEALVVFIVAPTAMIGVGSIAAIGPLTRAREKANRAVCMSNLSSINKSLIIYRASNDDKWPWLGDRITSWDTATVGTNRGVDPFGSHDNVKKPKSRSVTALMFMLVRSDQSPGIFRCPSDARSAVDANVRADEKDGDIQEGEYYWDFSKPENVSYSYQAPISNGAKVRKKARYLQGLDLHETDAVVAADMTPAAMDPNWKPRNLGNLRFQDPVTLTENSPNHQREQINVLYVAGNVKATKRPDVGASIHANIRSPIFSGKKDNIYTASGDPKTGSQSATSLDIKKHLSPRDTFLIGPVGRSESRDPNGS